MKKEGLSKRLVGACLVLLLTVSMIVAGCPAPPVPVREVPLPWPGWPGPEFEWRMQAFISAGHPLVVNSQDFFVGTVKRLSGGRLIIRSHGAGEIVGAMATRDAVSRRAIEMGKWWATFDAGVDPVAALLGVAAFGPGHEDQLAWWLRGGGKELMAEFYARLNVYPVGMFVEAAGTALHMREPWSTLEELKGRKFRVVGLQAEIFRRLGIGTSGIAGGEIYTAMALGLIAGAEWAGPMLNKALGFHRPGPYMLSPGWHEPGLLTLFIVNKDAWAGLPDDLKYIVRIAALATYTHYRMFTIHYNTRALNEMIAAGARVIRLPDEDIELLRATALEIMREFAAKSEFYRRVLESQLGYLEFREAFKDFDRF